MDLIPSNYMQGDPRLIDQIVYELKSQGIFDQFRKECISDVDTKPAYQNLRRRVEGSVANFLKKQKFSLNLNKNQLREQLRKNLSESGFLETGVERIVDQVVNPKINTTFLQKVEDVVYKFLGVQKPNRLDNEEESKSKELLSTDLEAVSPTPINEQTSANHKNKEEDIDINNTSSMTNESTKTEEDESPPFEPIEPNTSFTMHIEEHSIQSHISENSASAIINNNTSGLEELKATFESDISQDCSVASNNGEMNTATLTSDDNDKLEIDESDNVNVDKALDQEMEIDENEDKDNETEKSDERNEAGKIENKTDKEVKKIDDKKSSEYKRSHDKHSSKGDRDKRSDKDRGSSSRRYKDHRSSSKHSSSLSKDRNRYKEHRNGKSRDEMSEKDRHSDKDQSREKTSKNKDREYLKDREKSYRDKHELSRSKSSSSSNRHGKERTYSSSKREPSTRDKDRNEEKSSSYHKESTNHKHSDKNSSRDHSDRSKSSSNSSKDKKTDSRFRSNEKEKKSSGSNSGKDPIMSSNHEKIHSTSKKYKEKKSVDDHYSLKDKKNDRRSTDRDSNDGSSNRNGRNDSGSAENLLKNENKESGIFTSSGSGNGDSSNSENIETNAPVDAVDCHDVETKNEVKPKLKYIKPKFASNLKEAMKIMKIRKELAKLEQENQLSLTEIGTTENQCDDNVKELEVPEPRIIETNTEELSSDNQPELTKGQDISMENFEALEARLAEEMNNVQNIYDDDQDNDDDKSFSAHADIESIENVSQKSTVEEDDYYQINGQCIKKIVFENMDGNGFRTVKCEEIELVVNRDDCDIPIVTTKEQIDMKEEIHINKDSFCVDAERDSVEKSLEALHREIGKDDGNCGNVKNVKKMEQDEINNKKNDVEYESKHRHMRSVDDEEKAQKDEGELSGKLIKHAEGNLENERDLDKNDNGVQTNQKFIENMISIENLEIKSKSCDSSDNNDNSDLSNDVADDDLIQTNDKRSKNGFTGWNYDDIQCFYPPNANYQKQLETLSFYIRKLEKEIELMKENHQVMLPAFRINKSRKRKSQSIENQKLSLDDIHLAPKKRILNDNKIDAHNLYTSLTLLVDGTPSQGNFNLPPSPADSDQSGEQLRKEELPPFRQQKRTPRVSFIANQRYNSEDLYKPRPVFNCTSSRRRNGKGDDT